jgi:tetratricopeptide (TPR) repeat protein
MKRGVLVLVLLAAAAATTSAGDAVADNKPSTWDFARDPLERDRWRLHVTAQRHLHPSLPDSGDEPLTPFQLEKFQELNLEQARLALEEADAAHSPDPRLVFDLGAVYEKLASIQADKGLTEKVVDLLAPALAAHPDAPGATSAFYALAYALAKLDRPKEELAAWRAYIPRLVDDSMKLTPMMNMGEAEMRVGQLGTALSTFNGVLDLCKSLPNSASLSMAYALTYWDIAVALDRQGDARGALREAAKARAFSWTSASLQGVLKGRIVQTGWDAIQDEVDVFFVPDWEREWYLALGEAAFAEAAQPPREAADAWARAERHWDVYCDRAVAAGAREGGKGEQGTVADRWLAIARRRQLRAHQARLSAERAALPRAHQPGLSAERAAPPRKAAPASETP